VNRSDPQNDRFARHRLIEGFDQALVSRLRIGLIGAGAIGNEALKNLLLIGVGQVDVYDFDTVELSNLTRSVFLREADIGRNKAQAVVDRAQELHPNTQLRAIAGNIFETLGLLRAQQYDWLWCAVDNFEARLRINEIARIVQRPWINSAIDHQRVVIESFPNSSSQACYACNLPHSAYTRIEQRYSCGGLRRAAFLEKKVPTTTITASLAGALGLSEALSLLVQPKAEQHEPLAQRLYIDTGLGSSQRQQLSKDPDCMRCSSEIGQAAQIIDTDQSVLDWVSQRGNRDLPLVLSDPILLSGQCGICHQAVESTYLGHRLRALSDSLALCLRCNDHSMQLESIETITNFEQINGLHLQAHAPAWVQWGCHYLDRLLPQP
jgi:molybdopterin-synthase adenylyltransferase